MIMAACKPTASRCFGWLPVIFLYVRYFFFGGVMKANGVILDYTVESLDTTNALVGWAFTLQCAMAYILSPAGAYLLQYFTFRQLTVTGGVLAGLGYVASGLFCSSPWQLFLFHTVSGIGFGLQTLPAYFYLMFRYADNFSTIVSLAPSIIYVGIAVLPIVMATLIRHFGHDSAVVLFGACIWNCVIAGVAMKPTEETKKFYNSISQKERKSQNDLHVLDRYLVWFAPIFRHLRYTLCLILSCTSIYIYSSWSIFLVSLGQSIGFTAEMSVYLSTIGGVGGCIGSIIAFTMFSLKVISVEVGCVLPITINGIVLLVSAYSRNYTVMLLLMLTSGFVQGYHYAVLCGLMPTLICDFHLQDGIAVTFAIEGVLYQLGGVVSGAIKDYFGFTTSIFFLNSLLSFASLPMALVWAAVDKRPIKKCYS